MDTRNPRKRYSSRCGDFKRLIRKACTICFLHRKPSNKDRSSTSITYQKMHASPAPPDATFKHVRMDKDEDTWRFYRQPGDKQDLPTRSSHVILTACQQAQLFRTIQESLDLYCSPRTKVTAEMFLTIYARYLDWMQNLPPIIRDIDENDQPLPHVLYLQYAQLCIGGNSSC